MRDRSSEITSGRRSRAVAPTRECPNPSKMPETPDARALAMFSARFCLCGNGVRLRLGAHKRKSIHPLRRLAPQFQQNVAADRAADKHRFSDRQMIEKCDHVGGQLRP